MAAKHFPSNEKIGFLSEKKTTKEISQKFSGFWREILLLEGLCTIEGQREICKKKNMLFARQAGPRPTAILYAASFHERGDNVIA